jgi:hypothetical protein
VSAVSLCQERRDLSGNWRKIAGSAVAARSPSCIAGSPILELDDLASADVVGLDALLRVERQGARLNGLPESHPAQIERARNGTRTINARERTPCGAGSTVDAVSPAHRSQ